MLKIDNVVGGYGEDMVVRGLSLEVPDSSVIALIGPNGAGKSTTMRLISGLLRPKTGQIWFDGDDITSEPPDSRARSGVCLIPEGRAIFPSLTVRENLTLHGAATRGQMDGLSRALDVFPDLSSRLKHRAGDLSGGQQQMLALARVCVRQQRLVMVDEASLGLAPLVVDAIFAFLESIRSAGTSLIVVEQFVHRALNLADSVCVMVRGEIVFSGEANALSEEEIRERYFS